VPATLPLGGLGTPAGVAARQSSMVPAGRTKSSMLGAVELGGRCTSDPFGLRAACCAVAVADCSRHTCAVGRWRCRGAAAGSTMSTRPRASHSGRCLLIRDFRKLRTTLGATSFVPYQNKSGFEPDIFADSCWGKAA
jgi:hypothetical protein